MSRRLWIKTYLEIMLEKNDKIGDYTLVSFLGKGQFGEVWLAEKQLQFSKRKFRHALKFLSNLGDEIDLKSAEAEIDTWIEASGHPNVISVLDMLVHKEHIIIASEYADGGSLKGWLNKSDGKAPSQEKALEMMLGILSGIEHLHSRNVVHRDLKPDNILLQGNFPRITDFGVSRIVSSGSMSTKAIGSPAYMSPESFEGSKSPQTDIWSAGVILYEMLTGEHPYHSETIFGLVAAIQQNEPKPLPAYFPQELRRIVEMSLQKDLEKRFRTAHDMRLAIEQENYNFRVRPKTTAAETDRLIDVSAIINVPNATERVEENIDTAAVTTVPADVLEEADTRPRTEKAQDTQPSRIEETKDAFELEHQRNQQIEREIGPINTITNKDLEKRKTVQTKRKFLIVGGIAGVSSLGLAFGFIALTGGNYFQDENVNSVVSSRNPNVANITPKDITPNAPQGMVYISGGQFMMGRDDTKNEDEKPAHNVSVKPFFMDITEVTNERYAEFTKVVNYKPPAEWKSGLYPSGQERFPVVGVNWEDANAFAKWAGKRLPTEEEWEFAARGTENFLYPWGNEWKQGNANVSGKNFAETRTFPGKSPYGIYDMIGNAWEWTASDFKPYPNGKLAEASKAKANLKTIRGGSFEAIEESRTTTYRVGWKATGAETYSQTGFRCAKDLEK